MIKFSDVCKAYVRYWFVILICVILALGAVLIVAPKSDSYTAISTLAIENIDGTPISTGTAENTISITTRKTTNTAFYNSVLKKLSEKDEELFNKLRKGNKINKDTIIIRHDKNATFFTIGYTLTNEDDAKLVVNTISDIIIKDHDLSSGTKISYLSPTDVVVQESKLPIYCVIGILIGLVLGIVIVTFFVVFNPYVEDKSLLIKESETNVIGSIPKKEEEKAVSDLATNLELMLDEKNEKYLAFTTDAKKYDVSIMVNKLANIFKEDKKVLIVSYNEVNDKVDGVDYQVIDTRRIDKAEIDDMTKDYDMVLGICPNMITSKYYLHMSNIISDMIVVAKKWDSKTNNIINIKNMSKDKEIDVLGIVYQI